jgi:hypothetical protein
MSALAGLITWCFNVYPQFALWATAICARYAGSLEYLRINQAGVDPNGMFTITI